MNLPNDFLNNMKNQLGGEFEEFLTSYNEPPTKAMRLNTLKCDKSILNDMNIEEDKVPYENAYYLNNDLKLGNHPYHLAGLFYLQDPSAMIPVASVDVLDGALILDLCSAPGGKSTAIASKLPNGVLLSNEVMPDRAKILRENITRLGIKNCIITSNQPISLAQNLPNTFDYVFVDAPCSGEGMFRKEQIAINEWYKELPLSNAVRQLDILSSAKQCVKKGGLLIYSTCTFNTTENEGVVQKFLEQNPDFSLIEPNARILPYTAPSKLLPKTRHFFPHIARGEGQFVAVLQKIEGETGKANHLKPLTNQNDLKVVNEFIKKYTTLTDYTLYKIKDEIFISKVKMIDYKKLNPFTIGVLVGTLQKGRLIPDHNLFTAYGNEFINKVNLSLESNDLTKYLKGEELDISAELIGIVAVTVNGYPIGGGKAQNGKLKNYYPKKLRI